MRVATKRRTTLSVNRICFIVSLFFCFFVPKAVFVSVPARLFGIIQLCPESSIESHPAAKYRFLFYLSALGGIDVGIFFGFQGRKVERISKKVFSLLINALFGAFVYIYKGFVCLYKIFV